MKFKNLIQYLNCNVYPKIYLRDRNEKYEFLGLGHSNTPNPSKITISLVPFNERQDCSWNYNLEQTIQPTSYICKDLLKNTEEVYGDFPTDFISISSPTIKIIKTQTYPNKDEYQKLFDSAIAHIDSSLIEKVVIARKRNFEIEGEIDIVKAINYLIQNTEQCFVYCISLSPKHIFFGATPECLFQKNDYDIYSEAIAGTSSNSLLQELTSNKNLWENQIVSRHIAEKLEPFLLESAKISKPYIISPSEISHLKSKITGTLKDNISSNVLIKALHPTPAMCGYPQDKAEKFLDKEPFARGLYSGLMNFKFANVEQAPVLIRGLFLNNQNLDVYVGSGIVKGSTEEQEWQELNNKEKLLLDIIDLLRK